MEEIKKILASELKLGMQFDQPLFIDAYNMLLESRQAIEQKDLDSLQQWGIQELKTHGRSLTSLGTKQPEGHSAPKGHPKHF